MVSSVSLRSQYGNIQKLGTTLNNRAVYRVIDSDGNDAGKVSVAQDDVDKFEKSYIELMSTAPRIKEYVENNSSPEDLHKRKILSRICVATGGLVGIILPFMLIKNAGTTKRVLSSVAGIVSGISAGFAASLLITTPPGTFKFTRAARNIAKLDIKPVDDETVPSSIHRQ